MKPAPVFSARGLVKRYRLGETTVEALRGVDLEVIAGELVVVAGPSGSGKSTLLHLLGTLDEPDAGHLAIGGRPVSALGDRERTRLRRTRLGFVFQTFNLLPVLTALENVELPLWLAGVDASERRARARDLLGEVGLARRTGHRPDQLSGGERQRVAIARALVHRPLAVLADEPTGNLDSATGGEVLDLLLALNEEYATTFVVSSHDPAVVTRAPRCLRLQDGRVVADEKGAA